MSTQVPIPIPAGPPVPDANSPVASFDQQFEASLAWQKDVLAPGANALAQTTFVNANDAKASADASASSADDSADARDLAVAAALSAVNSPAAMATSATSLAVNAADKVFVLNEAGKDFAVGQFVVASSLAAPTVNYMTGRVNAYDKPTRLLTLGGVTPSGGGTHADWSIAVGVGPNNVPRVAYDDRATLRAMTPVQSASIVVSGVGLFSFVVGSVEPDDDETCFATSNGAWLLEAVSFDLVDAYIGTRIEESASSGLFRSVASTVGSVSAGQRLAMVVDMPGARPGDLAGICLSPSSTNVLNGNAIFYAAVTLADTVTVWFQAPNGGAGWATTGPWDITVMKKGN